MSTRAEWARWSAAVLGPFMFVASSFMPIFGGAAKQRAKCAGRTFTGQFDECFNDYLPVLELAVPALALTLVYMFARFAFVMWSSEPGRRRLRWRLASTSPSKHFWPILHALAAIGAIWAFWRAATYFFASELWPFATFWLAFAGWFVAALSAAWPLGPQSEE